MYEASPKGDRGQFRTGTFPGGPFSQNIGGVAIGRAGFAGAEKDVDLFQRTEEADEERRPAVRGASVSVEVGRAELAVSRDDGTAHGAVFVGALGPRLIL